MVVETDGSLADIIFRWHGSVLPHILPHTVFVGLISCAIVYVHNHHYEFTMSSIGHST